MRPLRFALLGLVALTAFVIACVYLAPGPTTRFLVGVERAHSGLERKEAVLPNGMRIVYLEGGQGEPLLLLHGIGDDKDNFVFVARDLVQTYHLVIPDLNGFGESSSPVDASYGTDAQVERLRVFVQALHLPGRLHLGGSSMGGWISLVYAAKYPKDIASLWLLDPAGLRSAPPSDRDRVMAETGGDPMLAVGRQGFRAEAKLAMNNPPFVPGPMMDYLGEEREKKLAMEMQVLHDLSKEGGLELRVSGLATPSLIVWGAHDHIFNPAAAQILHGLLPNSRVIIVADAGHLPMLEFPERCAADYLAFRIDLRETSHSTTPLH